MLNLEFADANIAGLITSGIRAAREGGHIKQQRVFRTKNSLFKNWHGRQFLNRIRAARVQKPNGVCVRGQFWAMPKT